MPKPTEVPLLELESVPGASGNESAPYLMADTVPVAQRTGPAAQLTLSSKGFSQFMFFMGVTFPVLTVLAYLLFMGVHNYVAHQVADSCETCAFAALTVNAAMVWLT